jgi:hypothetical protein
VAFRSVSAEPDACRVPLTVRSPPIMPLPDMLKLAFGWVTACCECSCCSPFDGC